MPKYSIGTLVNLMVTAALAFGAPPKIGDRAPELAIETLLKGPTDNDLSWEALKGQATVLEFWATWCGPCVAAIPHFNELAEEFSDQPVRFLSITDEEESIIEPFLDSQPISGWVGIDLDRSVFRDYGVVGIPATVMVDKEGVIQAVTHPQHVTKTALLDLVAGRRPDVPEKSTGTLFAVGDDGPEPVFQVLIRPSMSDHSGMSSRPGEKKIISFLPEHIIPAAFNARPGRFLIEAELPDQKYDVVINTAGRQVKWSHIFGPGVKVDSRAFEEVWNGDETETVHGRVQEASGAGCAPGRPHDSGGCGQAPSASEPGEHLEASGRGGTEGGVFERALQAREEPRSDDSGSARKDWRVDGGAGFFSTGVAALSRSERLRMLERDGELSERRQCRLLRISRSSLYYTPKGESPENLALMRRMDELSLQYPFYGSRQMRRSLRREGVRVGRHRIRRLMRLMSLEAIYPKPRTSVARSEHRVYPYLLRGLRIDEPNQVWCSDITYIPVYQGYLYLAAVMDWASRCVLSWRLSNTMDSELCVEALAEALLQGAPAIFNTDQGAQFTSRAFTERVQASGAQCSMDGRGRCLDNVFIERLWRSLKYEAVYLHELADGFEAARVIGEWMEFYNGERPHSALGGRTPREAHQGREAA